MDKHNNTVPQAEDTWSLDVLYKGMDDPQYQTDKEQLTKLIGEATAWLDQEGEPKARIIRAFELNEQLTSLILKLAQYLYLSQSVDTTNSRYTGELNSIFMSLTALEPFTVTLNQLVAADPDLDELAEADTLKSYRDLLERMKLSAEHQLTPELESMVAKLNLSGGNAWSNLFDNLTSTVEVEWEDGTVPLSTIRGLASDPDRDVRRRAYEAELAAYPKIETSIAFALNSIKTQVKLLAGERGFESPLDEALFKSRLSRETLDRMLGVMKSRVPVLHRYLRLKAEWLGVEQLAWYDLFAPVGKAARRYTVDEARELLKTVFEPLPEVWAVMERAFNERWIDLYPRSGKQGGAFCANLPEQGQSRVMTNFMGSLEDVNTFAHELGHAYHGYCIEEHAILNQDYTMPVAETASTFNETHLTLAMMEATDDPAEQLPALENFMMSTAQTVCDIYSRFLFEQEVFERCDQTFLNSEALQEIMLRTQAEAYGDTLDPDLRHPYMWTNQSHYYSPDLSYYNFPYAFGQLFSLGLYNQYQQEGEAFLPKYHDLLKETTVASCEDVAKTVGIDLTAPDLWEQAFDTIEELVDTYETLVKND